MSKGDGINYTEQFLSDDVYDTVDEAFEAAKRIAQTFNFTLTKGSNKINSAERDYRVYLYCSRGPMRKSSASTPPKRVSKTKKCNCPFKLAVRCRVVRGEWKFFIDGVGQTGDRTISKGFHNHFFVPYPEASTESNALTSEEKSEIRDMLATHTQPNKIRYALNKKLNSHHNINQIYNESYKFKKEN